MIRGMTLARSVGLTPNLATTGIGSMPHHSPREALAVIRRTCPEVPFWPQCTKRSHLESMYLQFARGLAGARIDGTRLVIDSDSPSFVEEAAEFYERYLELAESDGSREAGEWDLDSKRAPGFASFLEEGAGDAAAVKGQVVGPISFGLAVTDENGKSILYRQEVMDVASRHLRMVARAQESRLRGLGAPLTVVFADEPYLSTYGSAYFSYGREEVQLHLGEVLGGLRGLKGIHCCGNTDWSLVLSLADVISFDACDYLEHFTIYSREAAELLLRGGILAWGVVPTSEDRLAGETAQSVASRWESGARELVKAGGRSLRDIREVGRRSLLTPACGLGSLSIASAEKALLLLAEASSDLRRELGLGRALARPGQGEVGI